ncbi:MAG: hypothetical protein ACE5LH_05200 [Fidelibacterota bacterium]
MKRFLVLILPAALVGQVFHTGYLNPYNLYRISNGREISLPFRLGEVDLGYSRGSLEVRTTLAWEMRWSTGPRRSRLEVREASVAWYPPFGEIRLGKQIHAWGSVDGNNPTDNLSPYDYYYLFLPGAGRKIGSVSLSAAGYAGDWEIRGVLIPGHEPNRLPFNESDFPISLPPEPARSFWGELPDSVQYGIRVSRAFRVGDVSVSYFRGRDGIFSLVGMIFPPHTDTPVPRFGYRRTDVLGTDGVTFVGDLTLRGEAGFFRTVNDYDTRQFSLKMDGNASYIQYALELEYPGPSDVHLMGQVIGQTVLSVDGETMDPVAGQPVPLNKETFRAGLGTPFAMFIDRAFLAAADGVLMDGRLDFTATVLAGLEERGTMVGLSLDYSPVENWNLEGGFTLFRGGGAADGDNIFTDLEDFSHVQLGLKYAF